jgi:hypothetical protein
LRNTRIFFKLGALFHHGRKQVIANGIGLVFKIGKDPSAQGVFFIGGNQAVNGGLRHFQQTFASGLAGGCCRHGAVSPSQKCREQTRPLFQYRLKPPPP